MRPDPACPAVTAALAAGEPVEAAHLAGCAACRARADLVVTLAGTAAPLPACASALPSAAGLRGVTRARALRRVGTVATVVALAAAALVVARGTGPGEADAPVDLLAALDDADRVVAPLHLGDEDLLALLDPLADDPDPPRADDPAPDPLLDALLGEGSL